MLLRCGSDRLTTTSACRIPSLPSRTLASPTESLAAIMHRSSSVSSANWRVLCRAAACRVRRARARERSGFSELRIVWNHMGVSFVKWFRCVESCIKSFARFRCPMTVAASKRRCRRRPRAQLCAGVAPVREQLASSQPHKPPFHSTFVRTRRGDGPVEGADGGEVHRVDQPLDREITRRIGKPARASQDRPVFHQVENTRCDEHGFAVNKSEDLVAVGRRERGKSRSS